MVQLVPQSWYVRANKMRAQKGGYIGACFFPGVLMCSRGAMPGQVWAGGGQGGDSECCRVKLTDADKVVAKKTW